VHTAGRPLVAALPQIADGEPRRIAVEVVVARTFENEAGVAHELPWHDAGMEADAVVVEWCELNGPPVQRMRVHVRRRFGCGAEDEVAVSTFDKREVVVAENPWDGLERVDDTRLELVNWRLVDVGSGSPEEPDRGQLARGAECLAVGYADPMAMPVGIRLAEKEVRVVAAPGRDSRAQPLQHPLHDPLVASRPGRRHERPRIALPICSQLDG